MSKASEFAAKIDSRPHLSSGPLAAWVENTGGARIGVARDGSISEVYLTIEEAIALGAWLVEVYGDVAEVKA